MKVVASSVGTRHTFITFVARLVYANHACVRCDAAYVALACGKCGCIGGGHNANADAMLLCWWLRITRWGGGKQYPLPTRLTRAYALKTLCVMLQQSLVSAAALVKATT